MYNIPPGAEHHPYNPSNIPERKELLPHEVLQIEEECEEEISKEYGIDWGHLDEAIEAFSKLVEEKTKNFFK